MELPIYAMEDNSAIFVKNDHISYTGQIHCINKHYIVEKDNGNKWFIKNMIGYFPKLKFWKIFDLLLNFRVTVAKMLSVTPSVLWRLLFGQLKIIGKKRYSDIR